MQYATFEVNLINDAHVTEIHELCSEQNHYLVLHISILYLYEDRAFKNALQLKTTVLH